MCQLFTRLKIKRTGDKGAVEEWKRGVIDKLLNEIIPPHIPYNYDSAFSFLQRTRNFTQAPVRLTLFFPTYPLAIDVIGVEGRSNYLEAAPYIARAEWEILQADLSLKTERLQERRCPYLVIRDFDPVDTDSLRHSLKILTGSNLKR